MNRLIRERLKVANDKTETWYSIHSSSVGFEERDQVWLYNSKHYRGRPLKIQTKWEWPYTVKKKINDIVYRIQQGGQRKFKVVHLDCLAK